MKQLNVKFTDKEFQTLKRNKRVYCRNGHLYWNEYLLEVTKGEEKK